MKKYKDIEYTLKQSDRKTISIYVERDSSVSVLAPNKLSIAEIEDIIEEKRYWIYKQLAEWEDLNSSKVEREFVNGQGFLYLGRSYRLQIIEQQDVPLKLYQGYFYLRRDSLDQAEDVFEDYYKKKALERIPQRVDYYKKMVGVKPIDIKVMELQNRWASCSEDGRLNFHWKCIMAPLTIIDYIVVHELTHLIYPNHSDKFWNEVDKVLPDYLERKQWLKDNGASMDL